MTHARRVVLLFVILASAAAGARGSDAVEPPSPSAGRAAFERFARLEGRWRARSTQGWSEIISFEVAARGSVVVERTEFKDSPESLMFTMFHLDGDRLLLTHYCEARNQPRLAATSFQDGGKTVTFTFLDATGIRSRDQGHMDKAIYTFLDEDTFSSQWTWYNDGEETWMESIHFERVP